MRKLMNLSGASCVLELGQSSAAEPRDERSAPNAARSARLQKQHPPNDLAFKKTMPINQQATQQPLLYIPTNQHHNTGIRLATMP
ncbi:MAG: hypothetical protein ACMG6S_33500 [Byssovorax sp.]